MTWYRQNGSWIGYFWDTFCPGNLLERTSAVIISRTFQSLQFQAVVACIYMIRGFYEKDTFLFPTDRVWLRGIVGAKQRLRECLASLHGLAGSWDWEWLPPYCTLPSKARWGLCDSMIGHGEWLDLRDVTGATSRLTVSWVQRVPGSPWGPYRYCVIYVLLWMDSLLWTNSRHWSSWKWESEWTHTGHTTLMADSQWQYCDHGGLTVVTPCSWWAHTGHTMVMGGSQWSCCGHSGLTPANVVISPPAVHKDLSCPT